MSLIRPTLLLLHGAIGDSETLDPLVEALETDFDVHVPDLPGHGGKSAMTMSGGINALSRFLDNYINEQELDNPFVWGYSLGGYMALYHALVFPHVIKRLMTCGTKFNWNPEEAAKQVKLLNGDAIEIKVPAFAEVLKERHGPRHWKSVLKHTADLMTDLGLHPLLTPETVKQITIPVCITVGSEDQMVTRSESELMAQSLPQGEFKLLDGLPHAIEKMNTQLLVSLIRQWFA